MAAGAGDRGFVCVHVGGTLEMCRRVWVLFWCHLRRSPLIVAGLSHRVSQLNSRVDKAVFGHLCCLLVCPVKYWWDTLELGVQRR